MGLWGLRGDWAARRDLLVGGFRDLHPDLVVLQEVVVRPDYDQARDVLGYAFHLVHHDCRDGDGRGISVASRWPVTASRQLDLAVGPRSHGAAALIVEVDAPSGPLLLVNHRPSGPLDLEVERETQAVRTARDIDRLRPDPAAHVVLAGDLGADPAAASVRFWTGRQSLDGSSVCYRDCWEKVHPGRRGLTYTSKNPLVDDDDRPFGRTDYVLARRGGSGGASLAVRDCRLVFDRPRGGVQAGDHYGVLADLEPAGGPPAVIDRH
jgi:endonuclease/exonuclease/phosphatase family metal-dependent hydrolase